MASRKIAVILNPTSGSAPNCELIRAALHEALPEAELLCGSEGGDAERLAATALEQGFETIVAAGGDGTLNEVLNGLQANFHQARVGLIPLGTGNDFARTLGIPTTLEQALAVLRADHARPVDLIHVTGTQSRYCINVSAGGFSTIVSEKNTGEMKETWGPLSYVRSFFEALPELSDHKTEILLDGTETIKTPCYSIIVANARYVARGIPIAPQAEVDDGLADLIIVPTASAPALAILAPQILLGSHLDSDLIQFRRARRIKIHTEPAMTFNVDGEIIGSEPLVFEVIPKALQFIAPRGVE